MKKIGNRFYRNIGKRLFDLVVLLVGLPVLLLFAAVIALCIRLEMGSPVFFRQPRPGRFERVFTLLKFRTMTDERDEYGNLLPDTQRMTPTGSFLRKTSLDELPELLNVLKGEMSLVGPRPLLIRYLPFYTDYERKRFAARPGITGWAQVHGRNNLSWDERLAMDAWYIEHLSFWLDIKILWLTLLQVIKGKDVQVVPNLTMQDLDVERLKKSLPVQWAPREPCLDPDSLHSTQTN